MREGLLLVQVQVSLTIDCRGTIEVEHQWLLVLDPAHSLLPLPSEGAKPLPAHLARRSQAGADNRANDRIPRPDDPFYDAKWPQKWAEFYSARLASNPDSAPVDLGRPKSLWYYIGRTSTEAKPQYTADINSPVHDPTANFLATVRPTAASAASAASAAAAATAPPKTTALAVSGPSYSAPRPSAASLAATHRRSHPAPAPTGATPNKFAALASRGSMSSQQAPPPQVPGTNSNLSHTFTPNLPKTTSTSSSSSSSHRPYNGKYAINEDWKSSKGVHVDAQALRNQKAFLQSASAKGPSQIYSSANNGFYQQGLQTPLPPSTMGSASNGLPSMADVRRRSSQTLQSLDDFRRV